jgi:hypothetical protein
VPGPLGLLGGETHRRGLRVAEEDLRDRVEVGGDGVGAPGRGVQRPPGGSGAACANGHRVLGEEHHPPVVASLDGHPPGTVQPPMAAYEVGTHALHQCGILVVVPLDGLPRTFDVAGVCNGNNRSQQRLAGDAGPIIAFAAEQLFLHYHVAESVGTGALGESHADWTPPMTTTS